MAAAHAEWRAGKLNWDGRRVTADPRKGTFKLATGEDGLMHVTWTERSAVKANVAPEEDLIVMQDAYLDRIPECTTGRAYVMRYTSSDRKFLIWMQEPDESQDAARVMGFNDTIGAERPVAAPAAPAAPAAAAAAAPGAPAATAAQQEAMREQLRRLLGGDRDPPVHVHDVLTQEACLSLLDDDAIKEELKSLLPEGMQNDADLRKCLTSPQMRQASNVLTQAIHSEQIGLLFASLGLDPSVAQGSSGNFSALCTALQRKHGSGS